MLADSIEDMLLAKEAYQDGATMLVDCIDYYEYLKVDVERLRDLEVANQSFVFNMMCLYLRTFVERGMHQECYNYIEVLSSRFPVAFERML